VRAGQAGLQIIDRPLDHPGNQELLKIDGQQKADAAGQPVTVAPEIGPQQSQRVAGLEQLGDGRKEFDGSVPDKID
jgi:hypothetical protein